MTIWLPTVTGPKDLPDLRQWLLDHWKPGNLIADVFTESPWVHRTIKTAALWWVESDTCRVLADAAPTIPADTCLNLHDMPTPSGLAVLADDLEGIDADPDWKVLDGKVRISAVMWGPITIGIPSRDNPRQAEQVFEAIAIGTMARSLFRDGSVSKDDVVRVYPALAAMMAGSPGDQYPSSGDVFSYLGRSDWLPGTGPDDLLPGDDTVNPTTLRSKAEDRRLVAALWALTRTTIADVTEAKIPRATQRRAERKGLDPTVRVLRLGGERVARDHAPAGVSTREWHHSWVVSPHFRWQAHGPGRAERKLILVEAYRKGDPNLPLLGADRVWRVVPPKAS